MTSIARGDVQGSNLLAGKHAVVCGGARGVGQIAAIQLARAGAHVSVLDILDTSETVVEIEKEGGSAGGRQVDVTDRESVRDAVTSVATENGGIDVVAGLAAVYGSKTSIDDLDEEEVSRVVGVNFIGSLWLAQATLPYLRKSSGSMVLVGSLAGRVGGVLAGPHYAGSKGAVHTLVRSLAKSEAANGVRVNGVAPGAVATEMIAGKGYTGDYCPLARIAEPQEIANVITFLASFAASYVTGAVVDVNGGASFS